MPVPWKDNAATTLALDLDFVGPGELFVGAPCSGAFRSFREASLNLLPEEDIIEIHGESPGVGALLARAPERERQMSGRDPVGYLALLTRRTVQMGCSLGDRDEHWQDCEGNDRDHDPGQARKASALDP
jgi:hypothetical protein